MPNLSPRESAQVISAVGAANQLLQLDDIWTREAESLSWASGPSQSDPRLDELEAVVGEITSLLEQWPSHRQAIADLSNRYGDELNEAINELLWGDLLGPADRDDLRWLLARGTFQPSVLDLDSLISTGAAKEIRSLQEQLGHLRQGGAAPGDLSKEFRCGTASSMFTGGALMIPTGVVGGVFLAGSAAALSFATGGIGVAVAVSALWWARRHRC